MREVFSTTVSFQGSREELFIDKENDIHFSVGNLSWQPEDAIIGRSLFDANDFVRTLNKGIELANKGIKQVVLIGKE